MKTWILGSEYDFSDPVSAKRLMNMLDGCSGANSLRQISYALLTVVASLEDELKKSKEVTTELPTKYYALNCVDNEDGQGFSVFLAYKHTSPNVPSNRLLIQEAINQGILDAIYEDDINKVNEVTKEDYDHAMSL